ncbi:MAG: hypothetical protein ACE5I1_23335, partial [bacterium]
MKLSLRNSPLEGGQGGVKGSHGCRISLILSIIFLFNCLLAPGAFAQSREQIFVGARPLGLGETFVAIADDGNAVYWNPAGLPNVKQLEFNSMYANLYNIKGLKNGYVSLVLPVTSRLFLGGSFFDLGFDDGELDFSHTTVNLSAGARLLDNFFLGANFKFIDTNASLDGDAAGGADGIGIDAGALYSMPLKNKWLENITFGVMVYDLSGTEVSFDGDNRKEDILPQNIRFGAALRPKDEISLGGLMLKDALLAIDIDDRFHFGAEVWPLNHLALRGGVQKDLQTDESLTISLGGSIKIPRLPVQLDYAYISPPTLPATHAFSISLVPSPAPIKIKDIRVDDLFASFSKTYANKPIGYLDIRNDYDEALELTVKVSVPGLSLAPTQESFSLGPNQSNTTAFSAILSSDILNNSENSIRQVEAIVEYTIDNQPKTASSTQRFRLYGRGKITWEHPAKAAAFVTPLDPGVQLFADEILAQFSYRSEIELGNIYTAMQFFDALGQVGIRYTNDPNFATIDKTQHFVDFVRYPAELLVGKSGDCDDLTVLYASLLEYAGIRTAFISTHDHITLMLDSGIHERNWGLLPFDDSMLIVSPDSTHTIWIPVEVTAVGQPFAEAWQEGADRFYQGKADTSSGFE